MKVRRYVARALVIIMDEMFRRMPWLSRVAFRLVDRKRKDPCS